MGSIYSVRHLWYEIAKLCKAPALTAEDLKSQPHGTRPWQGKYGHFLNGNMANLITIYTFKLFNRFSTNFVIINDMSFKSIGMLENDLALIQS